MDQNYNFLYHYQAAPTPVGLSRNTNCHIDTQAIVDAILAQIGTSDCRCDAVISTIEEAKDEVIETLSNTCKCHVVSPCTDGCGLDFVNDEDGSININDLCGACYCRN